MRTEVKGAIAGVVEKIVGKKEVAAGAALLVAAVAFGAWKAIRSERVEVVAAPTPKTSESPAPEVEVPWWIREGINPGGVLVHDSPALIRRDYRDRLHGT